jgi:hypothetical protein
MNDKYYRVRDIHSFDIPAPRIRIPTDWVPLTIKDIIN